jgi:hypothetical protein
MKSPGQTETWRPPRDNVDDADPGRWIWHRAGRDLKMREGPSRFGAPQSEHRCRSFGRLLTLGAAWNPHHIFEPR